MLQGDLTLSQFPTSNQSSQSDFGLIVCSQYLWLCGLAMSCLPNSATSSESDRHISPRPNIALEHPLVQFWFEQFQINSSTEMNWIGFLTCFLVGFEISGSTVITALSLSSLRKDENLPKCSRAQKPI